MSLDYFDSPQMSDLISLVFDGFESDHVRASAGSRFVTDGHRHSRPHRLIPHRQNRPQFYRRRQNERRSEGTMISTVGHRLLRFEAALSVRFETACLF